jgi:hypothetical protein
MCDARDRQDLWDMRDVKEQTDVTPAAPPTQATLRSVTSIDAVQLTPSALDSWWATWVMPPLVIVAVQRVRSTIHLIRSPSTPAASGAPDGGRRGRTPSGPAHAVNRLGPNYRISAESLSASISSSKTP